jgi:hypothetical protein
MQTLLRSRALWAVDVDAEAYFGPADFLAQLLEIEIQLRNVGFQRPKRPFGWLLTHHNNSALKRRVMKGVLAKITSKGLSRNFQKSQFPNRECA